VTGAPPLGGAFTNKTMSLFSQLKAYIKQDQTVVLATVVRGPADWLGRKALFPAQGEAAGPLLETALAAEFQRDTLELMAQETTATRRYSGEAEDIEVFYEVYRPAPRLIVVGAVHVAAELVNFAQRFGFRTHVVDPRGAFATETRFPNVDALLRQWPDEALPKIGLTPDTAVVIVSHDPKLDDPALCLALPSPAFYVGALGSRKTHAQRVERLLAAGLSQSNLDRLHAPIGLNIGGRTPAEIALSIMAQIVAARNGKLATL
jgi:xanthine dehydrogenase accessory factor